MVLGAEAMRTLAESSVIIFGVGGVGSWCAESLIRTGVGSLTMVDSDIVCATNVNRQLQATSHNTGAVKVEELAARLRAINPAAKIVPLHRAYTSESAEIFGIPSYSACVDAIDSVSNKLHLIEYAWRSGIPLFSSMGAAAKRDPSKIRCATIGETVNCPLARIMRRELKKRGVPLSIACVFSSELPIEPKLPSPCGSEDCSCHNDRGARGDADGREMPDWCAQKKRINGALVYITAIFGFMLSHMVIESILASAKNR